MRRQGTGSRPGPKMRAPVSLSCAVICRVCGVSVGVLKGARWVGGKDEDTRRLWRGGHQPFPSLDTDAPMCPSTPRNTPGRHHTMSWRDEGGRSGGRGWPREDPGTPSRRCVSSSVEDDFPTNHTTHPSTPPRAQRPPQDHDDMCRATRQQ